MISHSDPERPALRLHEQHRMEQAWRRGAIGDTTYVRALVFAGEAPADAASRLRMLKAEPRQDHEAERDERSRKWLAAFASQERKVAP